MNGYSKLGLRAASLSAVCKMSRGRATVTGMFTVADPGIPMNEDGGFKSAQRLMTTAIPQL